MITKQELFQRFDKVVPGTVMSDKNDKFQDSEIYFERISLDGVEEMHRYSLDKRLYEFFEFNPFEQLEETKAYLQKLLVRMTSAIEERTTMYWFVRRKSDKYLIGTAGLVNMNYSRQSVEWGYGVDPELWGKGYILQLQEILKEYVFAILELNRLEGVTMIQNERTISSLLAAGMVNEGIARQHYCKNGVFYDGWRYSMLRSEYLEHAGRNVVKGIQFSTDDIMDIISSVLENEEINEDSNMYNTPSWDSLNHMIIMVALFERTKINLTPMQIANATSVVSITKLINGLAG
jgi:RimJ/RimL family protein N-acetyltransferase/acyl carrier protein